MTAVVMASSSYPVPRRMSAEVNRVVWIAARIAAESAVKANSAILTLATGTPRLRAAAEEPPTPTVLCALGITVADEWRGQGLSRSMIERMGEIGRNHGLATLIAPVRPTLKHRYPLTSIDRYLSWRRPDGTHLDPWLRTHERLGATIVKSAPESTVTTGTVAEWEEWTEMALPESGAYVVPGALVPIEIDREHDEGVYLEPNVWMVHSPVQP